MIEQIADAVRTMIRRVTLSEVDDSGAQQKMKLRGYAGEELDEVVRAQPFGFSSNPPAGAEGILVQLGGRADRAMVIGVEHPDHRPKAGKAGASIQYDAHGNSILCDEDGVTVTGAVKITLKVGGTTFAISDGAVDIQGGTLKHNGKNIGSTHTHSGVQSGPSNTGAPNA